MRSTLQLQRSATISSAFVPNLSMAADRSIQAAGAAVSRRTPSGTAAGRATDPLFIIEKEEVVHQRYLTLYNRAVRFPAHGLGKPQVHEFDIIGHPRSDFHFSVTFPFHSQTKEVTLIREFAQGINGLAYCLPTGGFDPRRHASWLECAQAELSEEAHLTGGRWECLLPDGHPGVAEVKWCANRFTPFACVDPDADLAPGGRDQEEFIQVLRVGLPELRQIMRSGDMLLPSVTTCYWALDWLAEHRLL